MKPFNLEEAIEGKPLVTRDGRKVLDIHYFINTPEPFPIIAFIQGNVAVSSYTINGQCFHDNESESDLLMYEEPKTYYINVFRGTSEPILTSNGYLKEEEAIKTGKTSEKYIKTISFQIP